jgi:hypothetical protein
MPHSPRRHAVDELDVVFFEAALALPGGHGAAQLVRLARREAGGQHRHLHHLLLEDRHAQRAAQGFLQAALG